MNKKLLLQYRSINSQISKFESIKNLNNLQKHYLKILLNLRQQIVNWIEKLPHQYQLSLKDYVIKGKSKFYCARFYDLDISIFEDCQHYLYDREKQDEEIDCCSSSVID